MQKEAYRDAPPGGQRHQQLHEDAQVQGAVQTQTGTHVPHSSVVVQHGTSKDGRSVGAEVVIP